VGASATPRPYRSTHSCIRVAYPACVFLPELQRFRTENRTLPWSSRTMITSISTGWPVQAFGRQCSAAGGIVFAVPGREVGNGEYGLLLRSCNWSVRRIPVAWSDARTRARAGPVCSRPGVNARIPFMGRASSSHDRSLEAIGSRGRTYKRQGGTNTPLGGAKRRCVSPDQLLVSHPDRPSRICASTRAWL